GSATKYKCHAGLQCVAMPVQIGNRKNLAVIGGRAFHSTHDYRALIERFRSGELEELLKSNPFDNVLFSSEPALDRLAEQIKTLTKNYKGGKFKPTAPTRGGAKVKQISPTEEAVNAEMQRLRSEVEYRTRLNESLRHFLE